MQVQKEAPEYPGLWRGLFAASGIGGWIVGQTGQIIHAGIQCKSNPFALFKGHTAPAGFDLGIIALVDSGQHLHLELCESAGIPQVF